jgi:hypothetical protein
MPQLNSIYFCCHSESPFFVGAKNLVSARKFIKIRSFAKFILSPSRSFSRQRRDQDDKERRTQDDIYSGVAMFPK